MATLATGLPATALTGLDLHQLDFFKRFHSLIFVPPLPRFPSAIAWIPTPAYRPNDGEGLRGDSLGLVQRKGVMAYR